MSPCCSSVILVVLIIICIFTTTTPAAAAAAAAVVAVVVAAVLKYYQLKPRTASPYRRAPDRSFKVWMNRWSQSSQQTLARSLSAFSCFDTLPRSASRLGISQLPKLRPWKTTYDCTLGFLAQDAWFPSSRPQPLSDTLLSVEVGTAPRGCHSFWSGHPQSSADVEPSAPCP